MKRTLYLVAVALVLSGCSDFVEQGTLPKDSVNAAKTIYASIDESTTDSRTYIEMGNQIYWSDNDEISYFPGETSNLQYRFTGNTGDKRGSFERVTTESSAGEYLDCNYAVYPFVESTTISNAGVISFELPATQHYAENSFGLGVNTMVAVTQNINDESLSFKNVCGYLKLQLYGDDVTVKTITFKGNDNERIAGAATITATYGISPSVTMADTATSTITLDCGEGVKLSGDATKPTVFWFVIPETTFEKGFTVKVTDVRGYEYTKSTNHLLSLKRNVIQPMKITCVECDNPVPNNQIWYTAINQIRPTRSDGFSVSIVSNEFDSETGRGVITFSGDVAKIGQEAFRECSSLIQISIPNSVMSIGTRAFMRCIMLTSVVLSDGISSIGDNALDGCYNLTNVILPNSTTHIGSFAFSGCSALTEITIPSNVATIGREAFNGCSAIMSVYCRPIYPPAIYYSRMNYNSEVIQWGTFPFTSGMKIYVPRESYSNYMQYLSYSNETTAQTNWCVYKSYIEPYDFD